MNKINKKHIFFGVLSLALVAIISVAGVLAYVSATDNKDESIDLPEVETELNFYDSPFYGYKPISDLSQVKFDPKTGEINVFPMVKVKEFATNSTVPVFLKVDVYLNLGNVMTNDKLAGIVEVDKSNVWLYDDSAAPSKLTFYFKTPKHNGETGACYTRLFLDPAKSTDVNWEDFDIQFNVTAVQGDNKTTKLETVEEAKKYFDKMLGTGA